MSFLVGQIVLFGEWRKFY